MSDPVPEPQSPEAAPAQSAGEAQGPPAAGAAESPAIQQAMKKMERAMAALSREERMALREIQQEIEQAAKVAGDEFDKRLEFCYMVKFSPDKISNQKLLAACDAYIDAVTAEE